MNTGKAFIDRSRAYLLNDYLPKIRLAVDALSTEDIWWRPNEDSNSIGNLILHLAGNARQWVVSGIGGAPDLRRRQEEFDAREGLSADRLMVHLDEALEEVDQTLSALPEAELASMRVIQGMDVSVLDALYHVVEHFSTHTGQIIYISKLRSGRDLGFWEVKDGKAIPKW
ncbi:MAG: DinB family protein [Gemmatimonadota bacterium]